MFDLILSIIIKGFLLLGVIYISLLCFPKSSPANRNFILRLTFLALLLLPFLSLIVPGWQVSNAFTMNSLDITLEPLITNPELNVESQAVSSGTNIMNLLIMIWSFGSILVFLRTMLGESIASHIKRNSLFAASYEIEKTVEYLSNEMNIKHPIDIGLSEHTLVPFATGLFQLTIILPKDALSWNDEKLKMVLTHELAHIKRKDIIWIMISSFISALYWFNPLVWVCRKKMIIDAEIVCDNYVLNKGGDAGIYAEHLLNIVRNLKYNLLVSPVNVNMARKTQLEGRLMSILSEQKRIITAKNSVIKIALITACILILPLASVQLIAGENELDIKTTQANEADKDKKIDEIKKQIQFLKQEYRTNKTKVDELYSNTNKEKIQELDENPVMVKQKNIELNLKKLMALLDELEGREPSEHKVITEEKYPSPDDFVVLTTTPEQIYTQQPEYPAEAKKEGIQGLVFINVLIDENGKVVKALIGKSSENKLLDEAALKAAYGCRYKPGMKDDKPIGCWITYKVDFVLSDNMQEG